MMGGVLLFCTRCNYGIVVAGALPTECPHCHSTTWTSAVKPQVAYQLSRKDRLFLRAIQIDPDADDS